MYNFNTNRSDYLILSYNLLTWDYLVWLKNRGVIVPNALS